MVRMSQWITDKRGSQADHTTTGSYISEIIMETKKQTKEQQQAKRHTHAHNPLKNPTTKK